MFWFIVTFICILVWMYLGVVAHGFIELHSHRKLIITKDIATIALVVVASGILYYGSHYLYQGIY